VPCRQAKEFLSSQGVAFRDINVAEDAEARLELIRLTGQMAVPVILVGDQVVRGFDKPRLRALLGL
jgi:glutaredoxin